MVYSDDNNSLGQQIQQLFKCQCEYARAVVHKTISFLRVESLDDFLKEVELSHGVRDLTAPQRHKRSEREFQGRSICLTHQN